jgi:hypothetical protein
MSKNIFFIANDDAVVNLYFMPGSTKPN